MSKVHNTRPVEIVLGQFLEGINQSCETARHLVHHKQDARWFSILSVLESVKKLCVDRVVDPMLKPKPIPKNESKIII